MNSSNVLSFVLFSDNTTVYVQNDSIDSAIEIFNTEFAKVALWFDSNKKGKVVYGQEPPSGESTNTECGFNYQLLQ